MMKNKKRKQMHAHQKEEEELQGPPKSSRVDFSQGTNEEQKTEAEDGKILFNLEEVSPWRNLQLILLLQNKHIDLPTKLEVACKYVLLRTSIREDSDNSLESLDTVSMSRVVVFVSNWIESVLISSVKKTREKGSQGHPETAGLCLDYRCWVILKFCLEESLKVNVSLNYSRDFLRVIDCISRDALACFSLELKDSKESALSSEGMELQQTVLSCISLIFSSHNGVANANLDLWIMVTDTVLELVRKIFNNKVDDSKAGIFVLQFSCYLLEPFARFLRVHPARKNGFHDFIDRLLEPLMHLLDELRRSTCKDLGWSKNLLKLVEEISSQGLFHAAHIDGFLSLQSTGKYKTSEDGKSKERIFFIKSYHRNLFDKLEKIIASKNSLPLGGVGALFHLFVVCATKKKGFSSVSQGSRQLEDSAGHIFERSSGSSNVALQRQNCSGSVSAVTRKSLFDFFVEIMESFLLHITTQLQAEWNVGTPLSDVLCVLISENKLLASFKQENIYTRLEDISEGACMNFLRFIYETMMLLSVKIKHLMSSFCSNVRNQEVLILVAKEIVVAVHLLVEIEYEVVGDDLESLWGMMFTFASSSQSMVDVPDKHLLISEIHILGCALINLYSELRQVNTSVFALCKAARHLVSAHKDGEACTSESYCSCSMSLSTLLCSLEFRLSIYNGIKSIPEGQVSGCIRLLTAEISESLKWLNAQLQLAPADDLSKPGCTDGGFSWFDLKAELLGRFLSEIYTLLLDSMTVTSGNCNAVGSSIKDLMELMCHSSNSQDLLKPDIMDKFFSLVSGQSTGWGVGLENDSLSCWLLVFFFRLYLSCRSLYRRVISHVPPHTSKNMSETMGDPCAAYSGKDWLDGIVQNAEGYFSWIIQPSANLLTVINNVSRTYFQDTLAGCPPLVYVLNAMTIQRLVDLNRMMKSFEYLLARNDKLIAAEMIDDTGVSYKRGKNWRKRLLSMKQEAAGLTKFMMLCFSSLFKDQLTISYDGGLSKCLSIQNLQNDNAWDLNVGALDQKTLPAAMWLIVCQHIDVWCRHASKKDLKQFLTHLINCSLLIGSGGNDKFRSHCINKVAHLRNVTTQQISLELLNDTGLYEQKFFRRHIASTFCQILEASLSSVSVDFGKGYLSSQHDWSEVICALRNPSNIIHVTKSAKNAEICRIEDVTPSSNTEHALCNSLLNYLSWMPKEILGPKSFQSFANCILKLEQLSIASVVTVAWNHSDCFRVAVGSLLGWYNTLLAGGHDELFQLFLSCRRSLKSLLMSSCEENMDYNHSSLISLLLEGSSPVLWLLESLLAVVGFQNASSEAVPSQLKDVLFSLMDHTSHMFLTVAKNQLQISMFFSGTDYNGKDNFAVGCQDTGLAEDEQHLNFHRDNDPCKSLVLVADILRERMQNSLACFSQTYASEKFGVLPEFQELKKLSPVISCIQGFLWGLASVLGNVDAENCKMRVRLSKCELEPLYKLNIFINTCAEYVSNFLQLFPLEDDSLAQNLAIAQKLDLPELDHPCLENEEVFDNRGADGNDVLHEEMSQVSEPFGNRGNNEVHYISDKSVVKGKSIPKNEDVESLLAKVQLFDSRRLRKSFLHELVRGDKLEEAYFLKQLFLAAAAILRLKLELGCTSLLQNIMPILFGISEVLLREFARDVAPPPSSFVWLNGVIKFVEELGNCFPSSSPILSRKLYGKLIDLHLRSIGKCIVLQGKIATLSSKETGSSMEKPIEWLNFSESSISHESSCLDDFIARLRTSFRVLVQKSSELHLLTAIQAIERAVVGVQEGCLTNYEIHIGSLGGGKVSSVVAAGIDCLDSLIEFVTGRKRLNVVKRRIQSLVACLFNIVLHLQGPSIFQGNVKFDEGYTGPDSGSVILMCIEVLRRVTGKHALFQMDASYVGQSLNIPAVIFQNLLQLQLSDSYSSTTSKTTDTCSLKITSGCILDGRYSLDLYAACCRLLCTLVKHHGSETRQCAALLEHSVGILLHCLEMVNIDPIVRGGNFAWEVQEGVKCACCLRRVYEEIRQQKDSLGRYCFQLLSCYIWVYCGFGPLKTGIRREIDEALRPGVYALVDACSSDELQHLHTVFGEGPCRSTLAVLQNDYKLYFQYEGKV